MIRTLLKFINDTQSAFPALSNSCELRDTLQHTKLKSKSSPTNRLPSSSLSHSHELTECTILARHSQPQNGGRTAPDTSVGGARRHTMDINNEAQAGQQAARHIYCLCSLSKESLEISFFPSSSLPLSLSPLICFLTPLLFFRLLMTFQCTSTLSSHFFYLLFYCLLPPISYPLSVLFLFSLSLCLHSISSFCSLCSIFLSCTSWSIKSSCSENMDVNIILKVGKCNKLYPFKLSRKSWKTEHN